MYQIKFFFSFYYFLFALVFKIFLLVFNYSQGQPVLNPILYFPSFFNEDLLWCLFFFLFFDFRNHLPELAFSRLNQTRTKIGFIIFGIIVFYQTITLKVYLLFGSFVNYALVTQVATANMKSSLTSEMDAVFYLLLIIFICLFFLVLFLHSRKIGLVVTVNKKSIVCAVLIFLIILFVNLLRSKASVNFYNLEKNSLMELLTTTIRDQGEQLSVAEIKETNEIKQESGLFSSIVQENKQIAALKVSLSSQERKKLNVVIYVLESTSAHYLGFKNPEFKHLTPNLNRIAEQALILNQHYTHEPASLKVRYALLRGKYTSATRNWSKFVAQVKKEITLGEILGNNGYQTLYLSAGDLSMHGEDTMLKGRFQKILDRKYLKEAYPDLKNFDMGIDDRAVAYEFEKYLKAAQKPFLAVLTPMNPHHPYDVPDPKYLLYKERKWWERYKNSLYYSDSVIGMVYESLVRQGKDKDTVFIIVSDHGEAFYQHPKNYAHAIYLYEENVFTVCLWSNPLLFAKKIVYDHPTSHVDITPSILDLLEITYPQDYDGNSIFQSHPANLALFYTTYGDFYYGLRDGPWKYIFNKSYGVSELYHLEDDPWEKNDLSTQNPELVAKFKERISRISRKIY